MLSTMIHLTFDVGRSLLSALTQDQEPASVQHLQIANGDVFSLQHDRFFDDQFDLNGISHSRSFALTGMFPSSISPKAKQQTSFLIPIHFYKIIIQDWHSWDWCCASCSLQ